MAGPSTGIDDLKCPVCKDDFTDPKLLPCGHMVCKCCIQSCLEKGGRTSKCPLCQEPLLPDATQNQPNPAGLVDLWPTDLVTKDLVEVRKILNSPPKCHMCPEKATTYCFQCAIKLCVKCSDYHRRLPATEDHVLEDVKTLTEKHLLDNHRSACQSHPKGTADMYCGRHNEVMCLTCSSTRHRGCAEVKPVKDAAKETRKKLDQDCKKLKRTGENLNNKIQAARTHFKKMRSRSTQFFDDLESAVQKRRRKIDHKIQKEEEKVLTSVTDLEHLYTSVTSHVRVAERTVELSGDDTLMRMQEAMTSRFSNLEARGRDNSCEPLKMLYFDDELVSDTRIAGKLVDPDEYDAMLSQGSHSDESSDGGHTTEEEEEEESASDDDGPSEYDDRSSNSDYSDKSVD